MDLDQIRVAIFCIEFSAERSQLRLLKWTVPLNGSNDACMMMMGSLFKLLQHDDFIHPSEKHIILLCRLTH